MDREEDTWSYDMHALPIFIIPPDIDPDMSLLPMVEILLLIHPLVFHCDWSIFSPWKVVHSCLAQLIKNVLFDLKIHMKKEPPVLAVV